MWWACADVTIQNVHAPSPIQTWIAGAHVCIWKKGFSQLDISLHKRNHSLSIYSKDQMLSTHLLHNVFHRTLLRTGKCTVPSPDSHRSLRFDMGCLCTLQRLWKYKSTNILKLLSNPCSNHRLIKYSEAFKHGKFSLHLFLYTFFNDFNLMKYTHRSVCIISYLLPCL